VDPTVLQNLVDQGTTFSESFSSGTITGEFFKDSVTLNSTDIGTVEFGIATDGTGTALSAGTIGLSPANDLTPQFVTAGTTATETFSLYLSQTEPEMVFGGIDPGKFL
jgi:hypothetical protein